MQIPILNGIYADENSDFRTSYPRNLIPVPKQQGISAGYLKPTEGIVEFGEGPGIDRGGIEWRNQCYRAMGIYLVRIEQDGSTVTIGEIGGSGQVTFDYSFDYLAVATDNNLFLYDGVVLKQVTEPDLGNVIDFIWIDGYFLATDSENLVVTELNDPFSVNPLKYGSSEVDPDEIKAILKVRDEACVLNRFTVETFQNVGGDNFPFARVEGAQISRGSIGTNCCCVFLETIVFLGSGKNEPVSIWIGANGSTIKIATREIDQILKQYSSAQLENVVFESRVFDGHEHLWVRLPDKTLVYDAAASKELEQPVWFILSSALIGDAQYRAQNLVWCYDKWLIGDPQSAKHGYLTDSAFKHWNDIYGWDFGTIILYGEGKGIIFNQMELVCLTGHVALGSDPSIWTQYSLDGETWSQERSIKAGKQGQRNKALVWFKNGMMRQWRIQRFRGTSDSRLAIARLEIEAEGLQR